MKRGAVTSSTDRPGWLLKRAQDALNAAMTTALRRHGASLPEYAVLTALAEEPGLSNADLARRAFVTPQTMNQVLRELEHRGWVSRHPHPEHGRILQAELTGPGRQVLAACHQAAAARALTSGDRVLSTASWDTPDDVVEGLLSVLALGGSLVQVANPDPTALPRRMQTEKVTRSLG